MASVLVAARGGVSAPEVLQSILNATFEALSLHARPPATPVAPLLAQVSLLFSCACLCWRESVPASRPGCVCVCVCVSVCVCVCVGVCECMRTCVQVYVHARVMLCMCLIRQIHKSCIDAFALVSHTTPGITPARTATVGGWGERECCSLSVSILSG